MKAPLILVVEDDASALEYAALVLERENYRVRKAGGGAEALRAMELEQPSLVVSDLQMPTMSGLELLTRIRDRWPTVPVMLLTVEEDVSIVVQAVQAGAVNYLVKPVAPGVLLAATAKALARSAASGPDPEEGAHPIIGSSAAIARVRHLVALASRSDVNVMVVGETGSGKELVARAVHRLSGAASRPFVAHNCAMTPTDLFDAEFFGYLRGAFTGAHRDRAGLLREADGGVLFLDELECLSLANQAKLLRLLDDGQVRPIGSDKPVAVCVRFVAATNRLPEAMRGAGELREDLYYRLRGFEVRLPPLRDRLEDLPLLAEHFLRGTGKHLGPTALEALRRCSWPGNVRQFRTVLQCAAARGPDQIDVGDLDLEIPGGPGGGSKAPPSAWNPHPPGGATLDDLERDAILRALETHGGNRSRAARALGIHRSTLLRRLREMDINEDPSDRARNKRR